MKAHNPPECWAQVHFGLSDVDCQHAHLPVCFCSQGQFKQPDIAFDSLSFGSDFERALKLPTSPLLNQAVSWLAAKMGGGVSVHVGGKRPHILAPLISAAQVVNVAQPGQQPDIRAPHEDMRLFDTGLVSRWTGRAGITLVASGHELERCLPRGQICGHLLCASTVRRRTDCMYHTPAYLLTTVMAAQPNLVGLAGPVCRKCTA